MNEIIIGIPKALLYYKYGILWTNFFEKLGCKVIISPNTNKKMLDDGKKLVIDEACLSLKIFMGHVLYLNDKCDYILVPRISCINKKEKVCTNFMALYDLTNNLIDSKLIGYNYDIKNGEDELYGFLSMGIELGFPINKIKKAYHDAKLEEKRIKFRKITRQNKLIAESNKIKILLAGHPYNLYDNLIGKEITDFLKLYDIELLYSDLYDNKYVNNDIKKIAPKNYFTFNKEIIGSISSMMDKIDGIILITSFPCGPDSLSNEMIVRNVKIPLINLIVDELNSHTGLITRLESFIDILIERRKIK